MLTFLYIEDPSLSSPLKKRPNSAVSHTPQGQHNDTTSSIITTSVSIKSELYDAPRRSLRQKGLVPEQTGFPYYSPTRPRRTPHKSNSAEKAAEGTSEEATTEEEKSDHEQETSKDDIAVMEVDGQHSTRRTSGWSHKLRSRSSNASESDSKRDDSPQRDKAKPELPSSYASSFASTTATATAENASKEVQILNNAHARRQIIRPWEDSNDTSKGVPLQIPTLNQLHTITQKKQLQNGSITPTNSTKTVNLQSGNHYIANHQEMDSNDINMPNSVQTAAEALVEIGQLASSSDTQDRTVKTMELETKKSTLSVDSAIDLSYGPLATNNSDPDVHLQASCLKEVVIDRTRQLSLFNRVTEATGNCTMEQMDRLHSIFEHIVFRHRMFVDKQKLLKVMIVYSVIIQLRNLVLCCVNSLVRSYNYCSIQKL